MARHPIPLHHCIYPSSNATSKPIVDMIGLLVANEREASSFYLDTVQGMSNPLGTEESDHHQGLARTHRLTDNSVHWFLSHSETDPGDQGNLSVYRYGGLLDDAHILRHSRPLTVAPMQQLLPINEQHPSDICFLPDVDNLDAGYLFVTEEFSGLLAIYAWDPVRLLFPLGILPLAASGMPQTRFPAKGPNFVFIDLVDGIYHLGVASDNWIGPGNNPGAVMLFSARADAVFPTCKQGEMNVSAFGASRPEMFDFPIAPSTGPSQCKLVKDSVGLWSLLVYCGDPGGDPTGPDYVDIYSVQFAPFSINPTAKRVHVVLPKGTTSFCNTGTHYVEPGGRILISSPYRWSNNEGPGTSAYVSRVDELASS
jgi:hypothetical protein